MPGTGIGIGVGKDGMGIGVDPDAQTYFDAVVANEGLVSNDEQSAYNV